MKQTQRLDKLEDGQGSAVRIAGWCDRSGEPFEPTAEFRQFVQEEACRMQADDVSWQWAVYLRGETAGSIVVLLAEGGRLQIIEVGTRNPR